MPNHLHGIIVLKTNVGAIHESPLQMTRQERRLMGLSKIIGRFNNVIGNANQYSAQQRRESRLATQLFIP
jgi:hypothetical protein